MGDDENGNYQQIDRLLTLALLKKPTLRIFLPSRKDNYNYGHFDLKM